MTQKTVARPKLLTRLLLGGMAGFTAGMTIKWLSGWVFQSGWMLFAGELICVSSILAFGAAGVLIAIRKIRSEKAGESSQDPN